MSSAKKKQRNRMHAEIARRKAAGLPYDDFWFDDQRRGLTHVMNLDTPQFRNAVKTLSAFLDVEPEQFQQRLGFLHDYRKAYEHELQKEMVRSLLYGAVR